jgi:hypothetical protein
MYMLNAELDWWTVSAVKNKNKLRIHGTSREPFAQAELYCNGRYMGSCGPARQMRFDFLIDRALEALPPDLLFQVRCDGRLIRYAGEFDGWRVEAPFVCRGGALLDIEERLSRGLVLGKKGNFVPKEQSDTFKDGCLQAYAALSEFFEAAYGYPVLVTHGTLLGLIRQGDLIPFDDDFDCLYMSGKRDVREVAKERDGIFRDLASHGFKVDMGTTGHIKAKRRDAKIDLMPAWITEDGRLCISGFTSVVMPADAIYPLSSLPFRGGAVRAFSRPELFLEHQYGPNWRTPDPGYRSKPSSDAKQNLEVLRIRQPA